MGTHYRHRPGAWQAAVAANVRAEAARRGVTQRGLAEQLGVSHTWVNARWFGRRPWQLDDLEAVAQVWGVDPVDLVTMVDGLPGAQRLPCPGHPSSQS